MPYGYVIARSVQTNESMQPVFVKHVVVVKIWINLVVPFYMWKCVTVIRLLIFAGSWELSPVNFQAFRLKSVGAEGTQNLAGLNPLNIKRNKIS